MIGLWLCLALTAPSLLRSVNPSRTLLQRKLGAPLGRPFFSRSRTMTRRVRQRARRAHVRFGQQGQPNGRIDKMMCRGDPQVTRYGTATRLASRRRLCLLSEAPCPISCSLRNLGDASASLFFCRSTTRLRILASPQIRRQNPSLLCGYVLGLTSVKPVVGPRAPLFRAHPIYADLATRRRPEGIGERVVCRPRGDDGRASGPSCVATPSCASSSAHRGSDQRSTPRIQAAARA